MKNPSRTSSGNKRQLMAIMFRDIVGYTAMMQQNEEKGREVRERHRDIFLKLMARTFSNSQFYGYDLCVEPIAAATVEASSLGKSYLSLIILESNKTFFRDMNSLREEMVF